MAILKIVKFGEPTLRKVSRPVDEIKQKIKKQKITEEAEDV